MPHLERGAQKKARARLMILMIVCQVGAVSGFGTLNHPKLLLILNGEAPEMGYHLSDDNAKTGNQMRHR